MNPGPQRGRLLGPWTPQRAWVWRFLRRRCSFRDTIFKGLEPPKAGENHCSRSQWRHGHELSSARGLHTGYTDSMRSQSPVWKRRTLAPSPVGETVVSTEGCCTTSCPCGLTYSPSCFLPVRHRADRIAPGASSTPPGCGSSVCRDSTLHRSLPGSRTCLPWLPLDCRCEWGEALSMALLCRFFPNVASQWALPDPGSSRSPHTPMSWCASALPKQHRTAPTTQLPTLTPAPAQSPFQDTLR